MKKLFTSGEILVEEKLDGERIQVHYDMLKGVEFFSRSFENVTQKFSELIPLIIEGFFKKEGLRNAILDCEIVGYDYKEENLLPFYFI
jgi:ATP-dependent DNA ligase